VIQNPRDMCNNQLLRQLDQIKGNEQDKNPTPTQTQQPSPHVHLGDCFTPHLQRHRVARQGDEYRGEGRWGDCCHLQNCTAAADPHPHRMYFQRLQRLPEFARPDAVVAVLQAPEPQVH
jgi:hypothetical protein